MKRTQKWILVSILSIVITFSGILAVWFIFIGNQPPGEDPTYPDLIIADSTLENDYLTIDVSNIGVSSATSVNIIVKIDTLALILYNISQNPIDLTINENFIFTINLTDFENNFVPHITYTINIQVDPDDEIEEISENNNEQNVIYYYDDGSFNLFSPNTYSLNSSIDEFAYAVQFNASQIILENSLTITNGTFNGYNVINSTILENSTISTSVSWISIALYGNQNLTMRNIWDLKFNIVLFDNSALSLFNCSIQQLDIAGSNDIFISNCTIKQIFSESNQVNKCSIRVKNNSTIENFTLSQPTDMELEFSSISNLFVMFSTNFYDIRTDHIISGTIKNCSIQNLLLYDQTNLKIKGTYLYQLVILGNTKLNLIECIISDAYVYQNAMAIFNNTVVLIEFEYGIIVDSNSLTIRDGLVEGTNYRNNTRFINADVSNRVLNTIVANNTGEIYVYNTSCNFYAYDNSKIVINNTKLLTQNIYGGYIGGSSELIGINSSFNTIMCYDNSSLKLSEKCAVETALINTTNNIIIHNCSFEQISWYSEAQVGYKAEIIHSSTEYFLAPPSSNVDIKNCSINLLCEGITFNSGTSYYNTSGFYGTGVVTDYLNITDSTISNREYKFILIEGNAEVVLEDLHDYLCITIESGNSTLKNCTIESLDMRNNSVVFANNCSFAGDGSSTIVEMLLRLKVISCNDDSQLSINNSITSNGFLIFLFDSANVTISDSTIFMIFLFQEARCLISYSEIGMIRVTSATSSGYAMNMLHCSVDSLVTSSWNYQDLSIIIFLLISFYI